MSYEFKEIFSDKATSSDGLCEVWTTVYYAWHRRMLFEGAVYRKTNLTDEERKRELVLRAYETDDDAATGAKNIHLAIRLHEDFVREQFRKRVGVGIEIVEKGKGVEERSRRKRKRRSEARA